MSMWEIDELLVGSIALVRESGLSDLDKKQTVWNLEALSSKYDLDAGGFEMSEADSGFDYQAMNAFQLAESVVTLADKQGNIAPIYGWSAFLLNFFGLVTHFDEGLEIEALKAAELGRIKGIYHRHDFSEYEPRHETLTIYPEGNEYFDDEQNALIKWFVAE